MTSLVTSKGQTVIPKPLRKRYKIEPGTTLDWQEDGQALRVVKLIHPPKAAPKVSARPARAKDFAGVDLDEPAFLPLDESLD
jgi:bifunctional DNA-binding transcriptional regulator/antitoxin component of YhaV-PrlF toxin-antitoxin module